MKTKLKHGFSLLLVGVLVWLASGGWLAAQSGGNYFDKITVGGDIDHYGTGVIRDTLDQTVQAAVTSGGWNLIATTGGSPNIYGGVIGNAISNDTYGGFIGGGGTNTTGVWGAAPLFNVIGADAHFSTIAGGIGNTIYERYSTIGGGHTNTIVDAAGYSTIAGGVSNHMGNAYSIIGGGYDNTVMGQWSVIGGGATNETKGSVNAILGGDYNYSSSGGYTTIGGGSYNTIGSGDETKNVNYTITATQELMWRTDHPSNYLYTLDGTSFGDYSVIAGGQRNAVGDPLSFVGGGKENWVSGFFSRTVTSPYDLIEDSTGCMTNTTTIACTSRYNNIVGGKWNEINNAYVEQVGGSLNTYCNVDGFSTIGGGYTNLITGTVAQGSVIAGGVDNTITATYGTVGGGITNTVTGLYGTIPGGRENTISADYGFAAGYRAAAAHRGAFVWADSTDAPFFSTAADSFNVRASGGVTLTTSGAGLALDGPVIVDGMAFTYTAPITITGVLTNVRLLFYQVP